MSDVETAWLAGLLEGDGSFELVKNGPETTAPTLRIAMLDKDIIERVAIIFGNTPVYYYLTPKGDKTMWRTQISKREIVEPILICILPFLGERRKAQAEKMLLAFANRDIKETDLGKRGS